MVAGIGFGFVGNGSCGMLTAPHVSRVPLCLTLATSSRTLTSLLLALVYEALSY